MNWWKAAIAQKRWNWREVPTRRQACAFAGTACLIFGIWAPVMEVLFFGEIAYAQYAQVESGVILALAVLAVLAAAFERFRLLWIAGAGTLVVLLVTAYRVMAMVAEAPTAKEPLMQAWLQSVQMGWAWIPLALGAVLLLAAAAGGRLLAPAAAADAADATPVGGAEDPAA